jgi:hypothetical protein
MGSMEGAPSLRCAGCGSCLPRGRRICCGSPGCADERRRQVQAARNRRLRIEWRSLGVCTGCGGRRRRDGAMCVRCLAIVARRRSAASKKRRELALLEAAAVKLADLRALRREIANRGVQPPLDRNPDHLRAVIRRLGLRTER